MVLNVEQESRVLRDGVRLDALLPEQPRRVAARLFDDEEVHALELARVFRLSWCFVGHESEFSEPNDFVLRYIGKDPVIVSRDRAGQLHVMLNLCRHRGMQVCRVDAGNATDFRCPYHGWTYGSDGRLLGVLAERETFGDRLDHEMLGLQKARVESYRGLVFATWNHAAPHLDEYLGDIRYYLDQVFGLTDSGTEVAGAPNRWVINCDWKFGAENFSGDGYHTAMTHRSLQDVGLFPEGALYQSMIGVNVADPRWGHGVRMSDPGVAAESVDQALSARFGYLGSPLVDQIARNLGEGQRELVRRGALPTVGTVFPNFSFLNTRLPTEEGGPPGPFLCIRTWAPRGPGELEVTSWALVERDAPAEVKDAARRTTTRAFSPSGIFEQDDAETWVGIQRAIRGAVGREQYLLYESSRPPADPAEWDWQEPDNRWPGPGSLYPGFSTEDNQWNWWRRWRELMNLPDDVVAKMVQATVS